MSWRKAADALRRREGDLCGLTGVHRDQTQRCTTGTGPQEQGTQAHEPIRLMVRIS